MAEGGDASDSSLKAWYEALRLGGSRATERLWDLYFQRMVQVARRKLHGSNRLVADEEDVALSAFNSFCQGFRLGRFEQAEQTRNLWPLLVTLTLNKAVDHLRRESRLKRSAANRNSGPAELATQPATTSDTPVWTDLISTQPTPEMIAAANESFERLLDSLDQTGDSTLRYVALQSMVGSTTSEIATQLECTPRTVQRKLATVWTIWERIA